MKRVLEELLESNPGLRVEYKEWHANASLLQKLARRHNLGTLSVPTIFVGDRAILGDGLAQELILREAVEDCAANGCRSPLR
jgi:glutaredoxin